MKIKKVIPKIFLTSLALSVISCCGIQRDFVYAQSSLDMNSNYTWITEPNNSIFLKKSFGDSAVIGDKIYYVGGGKEGQGYTQDIESYNVSTDEWELETSLPTTRFYLSVVSHNKKLYCIGGKNGSTYYDVVEIYDTETKTWSNGASYPRGVAGVSCSVVGDNIYCMGGETASSIASAVCIYDINNDIWTRGTSMSEYKSYGESVVVGNEIYYIGGYGATSDNKTARAFDTVASYNTETDTWESKANLSIKRAYHQAVRINNNIYCLGGYDYDDNKNKVVYDSIEVYDIKSDVWSDNVDSLPQRTSGFHCNEIDGVIYVSGGRDETNTLIPGMRMYMPEYKLKEFNSLKSIKQAESTLSTKDIETARTLVNELNEGEKKIYLQKRLNNIFPRDISLELKNSSAILDIYIKSENMLLMSLNTNQITFDDFSGVNDILKDDAIEISINSSLPYNLNSYLMTEIQNSDKSQTIDKEILQLKEDGEVDYQYFENTNEKVILKNNSSAGNDNIHFIDFKLKGGIAHEKDIYKTVVKFEAEQI